MMDGPAPVLTDRVIAAARSDFPDSELQTALWLLWECADDAERMGALIDADGDLATLVLAIEDRARLSHPASGR